MLTSKGVIRVRYIFVGCLAWNFLYLLKTIPEERVGRFASGIVALILGYATAVVVMFLVGLAMG